MPFVSKLQFEGYERVLHENPNYNRNPSWALNPPIGSRNNPSGAMLEGPCADLITNTARWLEPRKN